MDMLILITTPFLKNLSSDPIENLSTYNELTASILATEKRKR
jgi:hypothetical protein